MMPTVIVFDVLWWNRGTAGRPSSGGYGIEIGAARFLKVGEKNTGVHFCSAIMTAF